MNLKQKEQIITMRSHSCSYNQIAKLLKIPKTTIASFCQTRTIIPIDGTRPDYLLCKECGELFIPKTKRSQDFCSSRCRVAHWRKEKVTKETKEALRLEIEELADTPQDTSVHDSPEVLDFLPEKSDEWCIERVPLAIGRRKL